jgi:ribonuclease P protein component
MKQAFGRSLRLCRAKDFQSVFKQRNIFKESYCIVYTSPNSLAHSRLGVIISKKIVPLSTRRHQFKRIVRESFRFNQERLEGCDVIVMLKQHPESKAQLWSTLEPIWQKINHWRNTF